MSSLEELMDVRSQEDEYLGGIYTGKARILDRNEGTLQWQGDGIMVYNDGSKYEGLWKDGKRQGKAKMTFENGE
jgi:hypothetical protein